MMEKELLLSAALLSSLSATVISPKALTPSEPIQNTAPVIEVLDALVDLNGTYNPLNYAYYRDAEDTQNGNRKMTLDHVVYNDVDTSKAGVYKVTYRVTDSGGLTTEKSIRVTVRDRDAQKPVVPDVDDRDNHTPELICEKDTFYVGEHFDPLTFIRCVDKEDGEIKITPAHIESNNVDTSKPGQYRIDYVIKDSGGLTASASFIVFVKEKEVVENIPPKKDEDKEVEENIPPKKDEDKEVVENVPPKKDIVQTSDPTHLFSTLTMLTTSSMAIKKVLKAKKKA